MKASVALWILALVVTLVSARYQRVTGPTYPLSGRAQLGGEAVAWTLERAHAGPGGHRFTVAIRDTAARGTLEWRIGDGEWTAVPLAREDGALVAGVPNQGRGGRAHYRVTLENAGTRVLLPNEAGALLRFRDPVPAWVLIPHIFAMFLSMLLSTRAGLEAMRRVPNVASLVPWTVVVLFIGGIVLGCLVAWYAFRTPWTGFPVGRDITDSKTLIALVGWIAAWIAVRRSAPARAWVIGAALLMLAVFLIPHSAG